jgi:hypothetical protein
MSRMPKTVLLLLGVILYLCVVLIRIENQRYALWMGTCHSPYLEVQRRPPQLKDVEETLQCVRHTETRTHALWHLWYALVGEIF